MKSLVRWAIANTPAMNMLMIVVLAVGWFSFTGLRRETFPDFDIDTILVSVPYPGAAPQEVEEGICQKIEEAVRSIEGVKKVTSVAAESAGSVVLELDADVRNPDRVLDEVRSEVDRIPSFPVESEDPEIRRVTTRRSAIRVAVLGPESLTVAAELELRDLAERVRDELLLLEGVSQVDFIGGRDYQIDVEISEATLRAHGLTLTEVAEIVRRENRELPAGLIRGESQEVLLRGNNRRTTGEAIAELPVISQPSGAVLTLGDLGEVRDEFEDVAAINRINGRPAMAMSVERSSAEDMLAMVDAVQDYAARKQLPPGYELLTWSDQSVEVRGRLNLLYKNAFLGLLIVFALLVLFLDLRLAFWVAMGIPFSVLAAGAYLYFGGQTLNMISMFAFVMAMGIVVDDAIVVGENIYAHRQQGKSYKQAAIDGTYEVMPSVLTSVTTTIMAFAPLLFVSGMMGKFMAVMPAAIIAMLVASLFESMTILPCHLAHRDGMVFKVIRVVLYAFAWLVPVIHELNRQATRVLTWYIENIYLPTLAWALRNRSVMVAGCVGLLIVAIGFVRAGITPFVLFPKVDANTVSATIAFPDGTPERVTDQWTRHIEDAFWRVNERLASNGDVIGKTSYRVVGSQLSNQGGPPGGGATLTGSHVGSVEVELLDTELREISSEQIVNEWRKEIGPIPGAESLSVGARNFGPGGIPIEFKVLADMQHVEDLEEVVERCKHQLREYPGVFDVADDSVPGKWEYRFRVKPAAAALGVRTADLAETVRAAYYGQEVMRLQRGRHEVKLMVRYPREDRQRMANFDEVRIRLDDGIERPITEVAQIDVVRGYSEINRVNQKRSITITADVDDTVANAANIVADLRTSFMPEMLAEYPAVSVRWEGQAEQTRESLDSMKRGFAVAVLAMFLLLTFEFKSYFQPLLILMIVPFGVIGAIAGHALLGMPLTMFSMFGLVALSGIVVNDSIVLVDFINSRMRDGLPIDEALMDAGSRRFRPVLLTTVTTVGGLMPILLETSLQAQILIPMATSIAFGEIFATVLVLYQVPVGYSLYWSAQEGLRRLTRGGETVPAVEEGVAGGRVAPQETSQTAAAVARVILAGRNAACGCKAGHLSAAGQSAGGH